MQGLRNKPEVLQRTLRYQHFLMPFKSLSSPNQAVNQKSQPSLRTVWHQKLEKKKTPNLTTLQLFLSDLSKTLKISYTLFFKVLFLWIQFRSFRLHDNARCSSRIPMQRTQKHTKNNWLLCVGICSLSIQQVSSPETPITKFSRGRAEQTKSNN